MRAIRLSDFVFNVGAAPADSPGGPGFLIQASTNAFRSGADPETLCSPLISATCVAPVLISAPGWYTFVHHFWDDHGALAVDMLVLDRSGNAVQSWRGPRSTIPTTSAGLAAYGWFADEEIPGLAIDNSWLATGADQGKDGGWMTFTSPGVKHEGECVSAMARA